jgi:hypothetical protein
MIYIGQNFRSTPDPTQSEPEICIQMYYPYPNETQSIYNLPWPWEQISFNA